MENRLSLFGGIAAGFSTIGIGIIIEQPYLIALSIPIALFFTAVLYKNKYDNCTKDEVNE